jgi:ATP-binding protein involved in chromosome partitioning
MLGVHGKPMVSPGRKILPLTAHGGIGVMSIEFFLEEKDQAIVWRGPMLHKAIRQFLEDVDWGELDYLLVDLPPGTGDVSMTLAQLLPHARFVIVTTPQPAAQKVARRAAETAARFDLEVLGVVENMAGFVTPGGERFTIFGEGGGQLLADELDVPLLAKVPLQEELRAGADHGLPLVLTDPDAAASQAIFHAARGILAAAPLELALPAAAAAAPATPLPMAAPPPAAAPAQRAPAMGTPLPMFGGR